MSPTSSVGLLDIVMVVVYALMLLGGSAYALGLPATRVLPKGHPLYRKFGLGTMLMAIGAALGTWPGQLPFPDWIPDWTSMLLGLPIMFGGAWIMNKYTRQINKLYQQTASQQETTKG